MSSTIPRPPDGFADFVAARSDVLLRSAWLLTGDAGRAEDLLQTVLARAWRRWALIVAGGQPEAYVRRALYTTYVSWWRRRWRDEVPVTQPRDEADRHDLASEQAERDLVHRALGRLSRQQRAIVVLRYAEDRSLEQTADLLGCSTATVKVQSARALRTLRADPHLRFSPDQEAIR